MTDTLLTPAKIRLFTHFSVAPWFDPQVSFLNWPVVCGTHRALLYSLMWRIEEESTKQWDSCAVVQYGQVSFRELKGRWVLLKQLPDTVKEHQEQRRLEVEGDRQRLDLCGGLNWLQSKWKLPQVEFNSNDFMDSTMSWLPVVFLMMSFQTFKCPQQLWDLVSIQVWNRFGSPCVFFFSGKIKKDSLSSTIKCLDPSIFALIHQAFAWTPKSSSCDQDGQCTLCPLPTLPCWIK